MNKKLYILLSTLLLTSCADTQPSITSSSLSSLSSLISYSETTSSQDSTSSTISSKLTDDVFDSISQGYLCEGQLVVHYLSGTTTDLDYSDYVYKIHMNISSDLNSTSFIEYTGAYFDSTSTTDAPISSIYRSGCYTKYDVDGKEMLYSQNVGLNNEFTYSQVYYNSQALTWKQGGFSNFFNELKASDFNKFEDEGSYILKTGKANLSSTYLGIARQLYGGFGLGLDYFIIYVKNNNIDKLKFRMYPISGDLTYITGEYDVLYTGEDAVEKPTLIEDSYVDETFDNAMDKLKNYNYKVKTTLSTSSTSVIYEGETADKNSYHYKTYDSSNVLLSDDCVFINSNNEIQNALYIDNKAYADGSSYTLSNGFDFRPSFRLSSVFFDNNGNGIYSLNENAEQSYVESLTTLHFSPNVRFTSPSSIVLSNVNIKIENDKITFTTEFSYQNNVLFYTNYNMTIEYYDFDINTFKLDESIVITDSSNLRLSQIFSLSEDYMNAVTSIIPKDKIDNYPLLGQGFISYSAEVDQVNNVKLQLKSYVDTSKVSINTIVNNYVNILKENGFAKSSEVGPSMLTSNYYIKELDGVTYGIEIFTNADDIYLYLVYEGGE